MYPPSSPHRSCEATSTAPAPGFAFASGRRNPKLDQVDRFRCTKYWPLPRMLTDHRFVTQHRAAAAAAEHRGQRNVPAAGRRLHRLFSAAPPARSRPGSERRDRLVSDALSAAPRPQQPEQPSACQTCFMIWGSSPSRERRDEKDRGDRDELPLPPPRTLRHGEQPLHARHCKSPDRACRPPRRPRCRESKTDVCGVRERPVEAGDLARARRLHRT